jgi:TolB protein
MKRLFPCLGLALVVGCSLSPAPTVLPSTPPRTSPAVGGAFASEQAGDAVLPRTGAVPFATRADEPRLTNLRQLTHGGQNAEAYFSADGERLIFQSSPPGGTGCDQIYVMDIAGGNLRLVSTGLGRTTCGYFFPTADQVLFSSTHHRGPECPPPPDRTRGYVWPLHPYDIFVANPDGSGLHPLTDRLGYDAEATISPEGSRILFTSDRDGDLELYTMHADGTDVRRLTFDEGYDGGAFFSPDGGRIVYRAHHPTAPAELEDYRSLLRDNLIRPGRVELWLMDADGTNRRQITDNGAANFAPFFHPDGQRIIFSSNLHSPGGRDFDLYLINLDGTGLERVTRSPGFDSFPMFSPDGTKLVWSSYRGSDQGEANVFIADWVERP